jgi:hypothetical protein
MEALITGIMLGLVKEAQFSLLRKLDEKRHLEEKVGPVLLARIEPDPSGITHCSRRTSFICNQ